MQVHINLATYMYLVDYRHIKTFHITYDVSSHARNIRIDRCRFRLFGYTTPGFCSRKSCYSPTPSSHLDTDCYSSLLQYSWFTQRVSLELLRAILHKIQEGLVKTVNHQNESHGVYCGWLYFRWYQFSWIEQNLHIRAVQNLWPYHFPS